LEIQPDLFNDTTSNSNITSYGNVTISNTSSLYSAAGLGNYGTYIVNTSPYSGLTYNNSNHTSIQVSGDTKFEGDVTIKGVSIAKTLEDIQKRLAILVPNPEKLEHFEALKKAYDHYKTLEALCEVPKEDTNG